MLKSKYHLFMPVLDDVILWSNTCFLYSSAGCTAYSRPLAVGVLATGVTPPPSARSAGAINTTVIKWYLQLNGIMSINTSAHFKEAFKINEFAGHGTRESMNPLHFDMG